MSNGQKIQGDVNISGELSSINVASGWNKANETWTYLDSDIPTFRLTIPGDKTNKYSKGMKLKCKQNHSYTSIYPFSYNADLNDSVSGNIGTAIGAISTTLGTYAGGISCNGTSSAIRLTDNNNLHLGDSGNPFSFSFRFKSSSNTSQTIFSTGQWGTTFYGIAVVLAGTNNIAVNFATGGTDQAGSVYSNGNYADGNEHLLQFSFSNKWGQLYIDGILVGSGFVPIPTYLALGNNNPRVGCSYATTGNCLWFNGYIYDLCILNGYTIDDQFFKTVSSTATTSSQIPLVLTKHFIITSDPTYNSGTGLTTLTCYGGTDFTLANSTISNPYYSMVQQPFGFNRNPDKWSVYTISAPVSEFSLGYAPAPNYWYPIGNISLTAPIGCWVVYPYLSFSSMLSAANTIDIYGMISVSNTSSAPLLSPTLYNKSTGWYWATGKFSSSANITIKSKTNLYAMFCVINATATGMYIHYGSHFKITTVYL